MRRDDIDGAGDELEWVVWAECLGAASIHVLTGAIERGAADLEIDPSAWENTMAALEWAMMEHVHGRVQGPMTITEEDVERVRRIRALGSEALAGGERAAELGPLVRQFLPALAGPGWKGIVHEAERFLRALAQGLPPS
jgi:hypothetical protein